MADHIETLRAMRDREAESAARWPSVGPPFNQAAIRRDALDAAIAALTQAPEPVAYRNKAYPDELWTPFMFGQLKDYHDRFEPLYLAAPVAAKPVGVELLDLLWAQFYDNKDGALGDPKDTYRKLREALASSGRKVD